MLNRQQLKEFREIRGLTTRDVAAYCEISQPLIVQIENGARKVTEYNHKQNQNQISNVIEFFNKKVSDEDFVIVKQSDTYLEFGEITLEGKAKENYKELLCNPLTLNDIRILNNNYYFMGKSVNNKNEKFLNDMDFITKTISISANGNVFPGCLMSYDNIDRMCMFNISSCKGDFFDCVSDFCWKHPINEKALNIRNKFAAVKFCKEHNLTVDYMRDSDYDNLKVLNVAVNRYEEFAIDIHPMLPYLDYYEIDAMASAILVNEMFEKNISLGWIKLYLNWCTDFDKNTISSISSDWCKGFISHLSEINNKRQSTRTN